MYVMQYDIPCTSYLSMYMFVCIYIYNQLTFASRDAAFCLPKVLCSLAKELSSSMSCY